MALAPICPANSKDSTLSRDSEDQPEGGRFKLKSAKNHPWTGWIDGIKKTKDIRRSLEKRLLDFLFSVMQIFSEISEKMIF